MPTEIWVADEYLKASMPRTQGVLDLLARVAHPGPGLVLDLGCGPGNNTELIASRWPRARVIGVDSSPDMIAAASERARPGSLEFRLGDVTRWQPDQPADVVLLNAVLQWIPGHPALLPRLAAMLAPGGVLGFQMPGRVPSMGSSPSLMDVAKEMTTEPPWREKLSDAYGPNELLDPVGYIAALGDAGLRAEAWETWYTYPVAEGGLVEYATGAVLRPVLARLTPAEAERFLAEYAGRLAAASPSHVIGGERVQMLGLSRVFAVGRS